jgi:iron complex outermembrane receptor protein
MHGREAPGKYRGQTASPRGRGQSSAVRTGVAVLSQRRLIKRRNPFPQLRGSRPRPQSPPLIRKKMRGGGHAPAPRDTIKPGDTTMRFKSFLLGTLALPLSLPALAETSEPAASAPVQVAQAQVAQRGLEEIIVTAQRREENLQTTPVAVTAFSADALDSLQIENTQDIAKAVPNLTLIPVTASRSTLQVGLRGGAEQTGGLVLSESAMSVYVDDVYRGRLSAANIELSDIERIEVLRGPQGTLYGRNAFSGALKIVTRTPGEDRWANASLGYGAFDEIKAQGSFGTPIADGIGASVALLYRERDGYVFNPALNRDLGEEKNFAVRGKLALFGNETLKATATLAYTRDRNDAAGPTLIPVRFNEAPFPARAFVTDSSRAIPLGTTPYTSLTPIDPRGATDQFAATLDVSAELGAVTLRSITGYVDIDDEFYFDFSGGTRLPTGQFRANGLVRDSVAQTEQFSQELQAQGRAFDDRLDWIAGLYYLNEKSTQVFNDQLVLVPAVPVAFTFLPTTLQPTTNSYAAFTQGTFAVTDKLRLTAGLRYTKDKKKQTATIQNQFSDRSAPGAALVPINLSPSFSSWTPKFSIDYQITDDAFVYASVSRGFKAGGFNGIAIGNPTVLRFVYAPQTVWAYEAGLKLTSFDGRLRTNLVAFRNEFTDLQQTQQIGPGSFATNNVGNARLDGIELEVTAAIADGFTLFGNLGLMDEKYKSLNPLADAAVFGGRRLPLVAKWNFQAGFNYQSEPVVAGRFKVLLNTTYKHTGSYYSVVNNQLRTNGYGLLDASVGLATEDDRWSLTFAGKNIFDKVYFTTAATAAAIAVGEPRSWMLTLRWKM